MSEYIVKIDSNHVVWWDEGVFSKVFDKKKMSVLLKGSFKDCQNYIDKFNKERHAHVR